MSKLDITIYDLFGEKGDSGYVLVDAKKINEYINLAKALETKYEALNKDVARYFELDCSSTEDGVFHYRFVKTSKLENETISECEIRLETEYESLFEKLSKVGKEE